jgi:hypothetical protein
MLAYRVLSCRWLFAILGLIRSEEKRAHQSD